MNLQVGPNLFLPAAGGSTVRPGFPIFPVQGGPALDGGIHIRPAEGADVMRVAVDILPIIQRSIPAHGVQAIQI